jgi:hypothetical protein
MEPLPPELLNSELLNLENQLRAFVPQAPQTSREQLLYQAGWEAALAQHAAPMTASPAVAIQKTRQPSTNYYWAAACAALFLLSTALGWQVWQHPQPGAVPSVVTTTSVAPTVNAPTMKEAPAVTETPIATPTLAISEETLPLAASLFVDRQPSALASYLELRQRVTRGGLSMWSVSTPARGEPNALPVPARDWQAELLREAL